MERGVNGGKKAGGEIATYHVVYALLILCFIFPPYGASAQEGRGYLDISGGYKTGDFGTPTTSDLWYFSPTLGYVAPWYDFSVGTLSCAVSIVRIKAFQAIFVLSLL